MLIPEQSHNVSQFSVNVDMPNGATNFRVHGSKEHSINFEDTVVSDSPFNTCVLPDFSADWVDPFSNILSDLDENPCEGHPAQAKVRLERVRNS